MVTAFLLMSMACTRSPLTLPVPVDPAPKASVPSETVVQLEPIETPVQESVAATSTPPLPEPRVVPPSSPPAQDFEIWLEELRREAIGQNIKAEILDATLAELKPIDRVIELDRQQPESVLTFDTYLQRVVTETRVRQGRKLLAKHAVLLRKVAAKYHVPPRFIVALWGMETDFGRLGGKFPVVGALATLAYEGRRGAFFRKELLDALYILNAGDVSPEHMLGSWAGAMGQTQFMPSTFRGYAVDFNRDGRRDVWNSLGDIFGSAANYLTQIGWNKSQTWGREVRLPAEFDLKWVGLEHQKPLSEWRSLGVHSLGDSTLPRAPWNASLIQPAGAEGRAFLIYDNFRVLMQWNRSTYFATAVGMLADALIAPKK